MLTIDRATASFGSTTINTTSAATTFTITNAGDDSTGALATALSGAEAGSFAIGANTCTGTLAPASTCTVELKFAPLSIGAKSATVMVIGMPGGSVTAALDGEGLGLGALTISSTASALGDAVVGQTGTTVSTFTVTNTGTASTGALAVIPAGSEPQHFAKSNDLCSTMTLAPAATCTFEVRFAPLSAGAKAALFQIGATPGGTVTGSVTGTGFAPASLRGVPLQLELGSVVINQPSAALSVTVANVGGVASGAITQSITGSDFAITASTCNGTMVAAGTTCTVTIMFTPSSTGTKSGQLVLTGAPGGTVVTSLVGDGISVGQLSIAPSAHTFANTNVGQVATARQFTITNNGSAPTGALSVALGGGDATQYQIIAGSDLCTGIALAAAASCTVSVTFAPTAGGVAHAALTVAGSPGGAVHASLLGLGVSTASLAIAPPSRAFGSVVTGTMSPVLTFTVTNQGGQVSGVPAVSLTGVNAAQFAIAGSTCTATLAPGASCVVQIRFAPTTTGAATAAISVSATPGGTVTGDLLGGGIAAGGLIIIPSSTTFPLTSIGDSAGVQTLTVQNSGSAATGTVSISAAGGDFSSTNNCATLAPGAICTVSVIFTPTAIGQRTGIVTASANPGGEANAALAGTARSRLEIIALDSGPVMDPANLGSAIINNPTPHDVLILVRNNTSTAKPFGITPAFGSPAQYAVVSSTCGSTIGAAGGLCTVGVRFAPTATGTKAGSVTFDIGSGAQNQATQNLTGVGIEALVITALSGTDFGSVPINTMPGALKFRVTNPSGSQTSGPITATLAGGAAFTITADACTGQTLAAGASCLIDVSFAPSAVAAAMTTLGATASPGGMPFINITGAGVSPTGNPPTDLSLAPTSIAERAAVGSTVGTLTTVDTNVGDTFTYAFVGGAGSTDNAAFTINGAVVQTAGVFDFETKSTYAVRIRVTDSGGNIFEKPLTITITNVDEAPTAIDDAKTVNEDDPAAAIDVLANDTDVDAGPKMIASVTQPENGTVVVTGGGTGVTYTPAANFAGGDTFTYTLNGGSLATVTVTVTPVDDAPVSVADAFVIAEDSVANALTVLANDTDVDGGPIAIASITQPARGTLAIAAGGGSLTFTPEANFTGSDSFTYTLAPGGSTATVTLTVSSVDDPPVAVTDQFGMLEDDSFFIINVLQNDTDPDGGPKTIMSFTQAGHGSVTLDPTGLRYVPDANYFGTDQFEYTLNGGSVGTVRVEIISVNDAPLFAKGANQTRVEDSGAHTVSAWATAISPGPANESTELVQFFVTGNSNPTLFSVAPAVSPTGDLTYTLAANASGAATIELTLQDDGGTDNGGVDTSAAQTFTITVTEVNDTPVATADTLPAMGEDSGVNGIAFSTLLANDHAGPSESSQTLTVTAVSAPTGGTVAIANGQVEFTPAMNYGGPASFTYTITDNGTTNGAADPLTATATVTFSITEVNDTPTAMADSLSSIAEDSGTRTIAFSALLGNDTAGPANESGQTLNVTAVSAMAGGTVSISGTNILFVPAADFNGSASFTYTITDNGTTNGAPDPKTATGTVSFTITEVNDAPGATADPLSSSAEDSGTRAISFASVLGNDAKGPLDEAGQTLSVTGVTSGTGGTVSIANGQIEFVPEANFHGSASFSYEVTDNGTTDGAADPRTATASVSFTVTEVNDTPIAGNDTLASITEDATTTFAFADVLGNDTTGAPNESGQTLTVISAGNPVGGTVSVVAGGIRFEPTPNYNGAASFTYTMRDNGTTAGVSDFKTATATASFTILEANATPIPVNDMLPSIAEDSGTYVISFGTLTGNDSPGPNESSQTLTITDVQSSSGGTASIVNGQVEFVPSLNYNGSGSFQYTVTDNGTTAGAADPKSSTASVAFTITEVNDVPVAANDSLSAINEDSGTRTILFSALTGNDSPGPANESSQTLTVTSVSAAFGGTVSIVSGRVEFVPGSDFHGPAGFTYEITDNGTTNSLAAPKTGTGSVTFTINSTNDAPVAGGTGASLTEDQPATVAVSATDADGDILSFTIVTQPTHGTLGALGSVNCSSYGPNKCVAFLTYTPAANYNGPDSFTYEAFDGTATSNTGTVTIVVASDNDVPDAFNDSLTVNEDTLSQPLNVATNDLGLGDGGLVVTIVANPTNGTASVVAGTTTVTYKGNNDFSGADAFTYRITDAQGDFDEATVTVTVNSVDDAPTAVNDSFSVPQDDPGKVFDVLLNDLNADGGPKAITQITVSPTSGTVTVAPDGSSATYKPNAGYCNSQAGGTPDKFTYELNGGSKADVSVTVSCPSATACANNPKWTPVTCTSRWVWTSNRASAPSLAAANTQRVLQTGCNHVNEAGNAQGRCSLDGTGWVSTQSFTMLGCNSTWAHIELNTVFNCGGHDGDTYRHLALGPNDCYDY